MFTPTVVHPVGFEKCVKSWSPFTYRCGWSYCPGNPVYFSITCTAWIVLSFPECLRVECQNVCSLFRSSFLAKESVLLGFSHLLPQFGSSLLCLLSSILVLHWRMPWPLPCSLSFNISVFRAGEMMHKLRVHITVAEDVSPVPRELNSKHPQQTDYNSL